MGSALPEPLLHADVPPARVALEPLCRTLRALWGLAADVRCDADADADDRLPHLAGRTIHLPLRAPDGGDADAWRLAAATHAAAPLLYSPPALHGRGPKPIGGGAPRGRRTPPPPSSTRRRRSTAAA